MEKNKIRVLMVGGRRCGKSTTLAGMLDKANSTIENTRLVFANQDNNITFKFADKITRLKSEYFDDIQSKAFASVPIIKAGTSAGEKYPVDLNLIGTKESLKIEFIDVPGEYYEVHFGADTPEEFERRSAEMKEWLDTSSVFIVAVDTPFLMEDKSEATGYGKYHKSNCPQEITELLKGINFNDGEKRKFIFVPLKCEKYYGEGNRPNRMPEVVETIRKGYEDLLSYLAAPGIKELCEVVIAPVISIGGIMFSKFIDDQSEPDSSAEYIYTNGPDSKYDPKYCEQPLLHTLVFILERAAMYASGNTGYDTDRRNIIEIIIDWVVKHLPFKFKNKNGVEIDLSNEFSKEVYNLREYIVNDSSNGFVVIQ